MCRRLPAWSRIRCPSPNGRRRRTRRVQFCAPPSKCKTASIATSDPGEKTMLLMIDNYDSFTYNLVQYFGELGEDVRTFRNDEISLSEIAKLNPERICLSPGPSNPQHAGITLDVLREFSGQIPILGVCLGHQAIGEAFGGRVVRAQTIMHGKVSTIETDCRGVFADLPKHFSVTRYHSLAIERESLPDCLEISAWTPDGEIMGVRHKELAVEGVQFHPESILSEHGHALLGNFVKGSRQSERA